MMNLDDYFKLANEHEIYCNINCNKNSYRRHTAECVLLASQHCNSYVECHSSYCKEYLLRFNLVYSHKKKVIQQDKIMDLTYYTDDEDDIEIIYL